MKRGSVVALCAAACLAACEGIVRHEVTLTFDDSGKHVTIAAATTLPDAKEARDRARVERIREDMVAGRDEWSLRFANANPDQDRVIFERQRGEIVRVERSATIDTENLQKFFFDLPISATVTRGPGWSELTIYPGTSTRAARLERDNIEKKLRIYSERAVHYFAAVRAMYEYLDEKPQRATDVFTALFRKPDDPRPPVVNDVEHDLVATVVHSIDLLADIEGESSSDLEREADLVFNPFPATLVVRVPGDPLLVEGFSRDRSGSLIVATKSLLEAIASLEGKWISPDPLAVALRSDSEHLEEAAAEIAAQPRHAESVISANEVAEALTQKMRPAPRYRVRFSSKAAEP